MTQRVNIAVYNAILERSKAKGAGLAFLLVLAKWSDETGACYPSLRTLASKLHVTIREVQRVEHNLIVQKELTVDTRTGPQGVNQYRICCVVAKPARESTVAHPVEVTPRSATTTWSLSTPTSCPHVETGGDPTTKVASVSLFLNNQVNNQKEEGPPTSFQAGNGEREPAVHEADITARVSVIRGELEKRIDPHTFKTFFRHMYLVGINSGVLALHVPNDFAAQVVSKKTEVIVQAVRTAGLDIDGVRVEVAA